MPDEDQTGPRGEGPLTGRGLGRAGAEANLEERTRREAERRKAKEEAKAAAPATSIDAYFYNLGQQMKLTKEVVKTAAPLAFNLTVAGAATVFGLATVGTLSPIVGTALAGGGAVGSMIKGKPLKDIVNDSLRTYSTINIVLCPVLGVWNATMPLIPNDLFIGKAARALYAITGINTLFVGLYKPTDYLIANYFNPTGVIDHTIDNFYNDWKRPAKGFSPGYSLAANGVETILGFPTFAINAGGLGLYNALKPVLGTEKPEEQKNEVEQKSPATAQTYDFPQQKPYTNKKAA